jgi:hypothetical protein
MLNYFKDYFERNMLQVYSTELLDEMKGIVRDQGSIAAYGRGKDDRVIASALACAAYAEQVQPRLLAMRITREQKPTKTDQKVPKLLKSKSKSATTSRRLGSNYGRSASER